MITLIGKKDSQEFRVLQEKLDKLTLSYQMQYTSERAYIQDGKVAIKGAEKLDKYLVELEQDLQHWYYCI